MKESGDAIITSPSTVESEAEEKEEESSIRNVEIFELHSKEEQPVSEVDGIMQENTSKEKIVESDGSCLNEQLNETDDNISSFKENLGENDEEEKQIPGVDEALVEKEENDSTGNEGLGELGNASLQLDEELIQLCEKDEKIFSYEGVLVENEENILITGQGIANNNEVSDFAGACLNQKLKVELPHVEEEDNKVSSEVVTVENEKISIIEEVFREKEEANADRDEDGMCKKTDENHVNFDKTHLIVQLNEELPPVDEVHNTSKVVIVKNEKVSITEEVFREKEEVNEDIDVEVMCKKADENHVNLDKTCLNEQLNEELLQVNEEANKALLHEIVAVEKEKASILEERFGKNEEQAVDIAHKHADEKQFHHGGEHIVKHPSEESPETDEKFLSSRETLVANVSLLEKRVCGVSVCESDEVMHDSVENKSNVSLSKFTESLNEKDVEFSTLQDEADNEEKTSSFKDENAQKVSAHEPSAPNLYVNVVEEQSMEEPNAQSIERSIDEESFHESVDVMHDCVEYKLDVSISKLGSLNEKDVKPSTLQVEPVTEKERAFFKDENSQKVSAYEPYASNLDVNVAKEQFIEELNAQSVEQPIGDESIYESDDVMHDCIENKSGVSVLKITDSLNGRHVKPSTLQDEPITKEGKASSSKDENGQGVFAHEPSAPNLDVNVAKEQTIEELNARDGNFNLLQETLVVKDENHVTLNNALVAENVHSEGLAAKSETNLSMKGGLNRIEIAKEDNDKNILQQEIIPNKEEDSFDKQDEVDEMDIDEGGPATSVGKRSTMKRKNGQSKQSQNKRVRVRQKHKEDESLCFICFDGGDLVVCDHRRCPKVYHPLCVNREEEYFKAKGQWICGWHICNSCEKNAHYMCYTCTYSMCKGCFKSSEFACVRGSKGFCKECIEIVVTIERKKAADQTKDTGEVDELFLFKDYWLELNEKLSLTMEELTRASNQLKEPNVASTNKEETLSKTRAGKREVELSGDKPENSNEEKQVSSSRRLKQKKETTSSAINRLKKRLRKPKNVSTSSEWASKELLDFVAHMKDGDRSEISQFDVHDLLLAYIKRHNLRDPSRKSQIICDSMLHDLFGKPRVGHLEMPKLLQPHFLIKETPVLATDENEGGVVDPDPKRMVSEGSSDAFSKSMSDKRRKSHKNSGEKRLAYDDEAYAAVDVHNVSKMYLRRNLIENLLDDAGMFNEKVVGAFARIRISGSAPNKDMYRLVQIVGTGKAANMYNTGRKTTDITLEIVNLNKREYFTIDLISNQEFTEEECKRLRQSVRCGLIDRMTVAQAQEKANALHAVKVNDSLESEKLRFINLRDRASEQGRKKDHRLSVEKLQLLSTPEELSRRLNELPVIHVDPNMDLDYVSSDDEEDQHVRNQDNRKASTFLFRDASKKLSVPKNEDNDTRQSTSPITPKSETKTTNSNTSAINNALPIRAPVQPSNIAPQSTAQTPSTSHNLNENEKMWHYVDPSGKIQGPFSMTQLRKWNANKYFPINLRIWRTTQKQEDSVLLTDALEGKLNDAAQPTNMATLVDPRASNLSARQTHITSASQPTNMKPLVDSKSSNFSATSSPTRQSQLHSNHSSGTNSRKPENNRRWDDGHNRQSNWDSDRPNRKFQSSNNNDNNRGSDKQNVHHSSRDRQSSNIDWAGLQGAINNMLPSAKLNKVEPSQVNPTPNVDIQPPNDQNLTLNHSSAPIVPDASAQQQQQMATNMNMPYQAVPNAANMGWGMMAAQTPSMNVNNVNWGGAANMNMGWGPTTAQQMGNPNMNVGWVMPGQGMPMQANPGWVAAPNHGNAGWVAPQAPGVNSSSQLNPNNAPAPAPAPVPVGVCQFFMNGHCKKGISCNYLHP